MPVGVDPDDGHPEPDRHACHPSPDVAATPEVATEEVAEEVLAEETPAEDEPAEEEPAKE